MILWGFIFYQKDCFSANFYQLMLINCEFQELLIKNFKIWWITIG